MDHFVHNNHHNNVPFVTKFAHYRVVIKMAFCQQFLQSQYISYFIYKIPSICSHRSNPNKTPEICYKSYDGANQESGAIHVRDALNSEGAMRRWSRNALNSEGAMRRWSRNALNSEGAMRRWSRNALNSEGAMRRWSRSCCEETMQNCQKAATRDLERLGDINTQWDRPEE